MDNNLKPLKVLLINGSPRMDSNSSLLIKEMVSVFNALAVKCEEIEIGTKDIRGCISCNQCAKKDGCVFDDIVNETAKKFKEADGLIVVSPVYFASPNGTVISFLDRLFHSRYYDVRMKVGAAFVIARRAGTTASFDVLNKYFTISGMPVVSGDYWNNGFGLSQGQIIKDEEGLRNARVVAKRMVFLMSAIREGKEKYPELLEEEKRVSTHFIK